MNQTVSTSMELLRRGEGLHLLLIGTVFSSFLIPVVVILFYFSDSFLRRRPVFLLNLSGVLLGLVEGAVTIHTFSIFVLDSSPQISPTLLTAFSSLVLLVPPYVQSILLLRATSGCSSRLLSLRGRVALCIPMVFLKGVRVPIAGILLSHLRNAPEAKWESNMTYVQVLWVLQLLDDVYASLLLAIRSSWLSNTWTLPQCDLQKIFRMVLSTFSIPVLLDIIQVIQAFLHPRFATGLYIPLANSYVQIICVLLATIWATEVQDTHVSSVGRDVEHTPESSTTSCPSYIRRRISEELTSPSIRKAFAESVRDSGTAVGEEDAEERLKWLAELGKERMHGPMPPSLCTAATFDNTGQPPPVFYAV